MSLVPALFERVDFLESIVGRRHEISFSVSLVLGTLRGQTIGIRHVSEEFPRGDTWKVTNVPDRQGIPADLR
jgi:hypothetical protein